MKRSQPAAHPCSRCPVRPPEADNGSTIAFFTTTDTAVNGDGWICGEPGGALQQCSEEQLEAAAKKGGVRVVVDLDNGTAVTIDEEHN